MIQILIARRLPEFAGLSPQARDLAWRSCVHPLVACWRSAITKTLLLAAVIAGGWHLGMFATTFSTMILFAGAWIICDLHDVAVLIRGRKHVRQYVADHREELVQMVPPSTPGRRR